MSILFKGNLEEGNYTLIKSTDGWVLKGETSYVGFNFADRPQGEWIDKGWNGDWQFQTDGRGNSWHEYECSECGFHNKGGKSNFCPSCGAVMKQNL